MPATCVTHSNETVAEAQWYFVTCKTTVWKGHISLLGTFDLERSKRPNSTIVQTCKIHGTFEGPGCIYEVGLRVGVYRIVLKCSEQKRFFRLQTNDFGNH